MRTVEDGTDEDDDDGEGEGEDESEDKIEEGKTSKGDEDLRSDSHCSYESSGSSNLPKLSVVEVAQEFKADLSSVP